MSELDLDAMRHALETARRLGVRRVSIKEGDLAMTAILAEPDEDDAPYVDADAAPTGPVLKDVAASHVGYIKFADPAPAPGDTLEKGQRVAEIIALGLVNEVVSKIGGEIEEVLVAQNEPVEFGQPILRVKVKE